MSHFERGANAARRRPAVISCNGAPFRFAALLAFFMQKEYKFFFSARKVVRRGGTYVS